MKGEEEKSEEKKEEAFLKLGGTAINSTDHWDPVAALQKANKRDTKKTLNKDLSGRPPRDPSLESRLKKQREERKQRGPK